MKFIYPLAASLLLAACVINPSVPAAPPRVPDLGVLWVKNAAEYHAITRQIYRTAARALPAFIEDPEWSAVPQQQDAAGLPPAVILDVDETVVSNVDFQLSFEPPFENRKLDEWTDATPATPVQGVREFVDEARRLGVTVFFVTNRPCELRDGSDDACPQKRTAIDDIAEAGISTDANHVMLSRENGWTREKLGRRLHVAENYRVIMLIGDDYGDFVECTRRRALTPCTRGATRASRLADLERYDKYWGNGWYILPNPMHGSWTSVQ